MTSSALSIVSPQRRLLPAVHRRLDLVPAPLLKILQSLAENKAPWPLLLHGPPGRGKTCAALALADICETAGYWTAEGLCDATMNRDETTWTDVGEKHLAILDELGARSNVGELAYSVVKRFTDLREQHAGRVAIYISNVEPRKLAGLYDDRIASRIRCGTEFELTGNDRRRTR